MQIEPIVKLAEYNGCKVAIEQQTVVAYFPGMEIAEVWGIESEAQARAFVQKAFAVWYEKEPSFSGLSTESRPSKLRPYVFEPTPQIPDPNFVFTVWPYMPNKFPTGLRTTRRV